MYLHVSVFQTIYPVVQLMILCRVGLYESNHLSSCEQKRRNKPPAG